MVEQPIDYFLIVWFALALLSTAYVAWDQFRNNPEPVVMRWGFILVTLYMGPFGLLLYVLADKVPRPGTHEEFTSPLWKQGTGSTIHCCAGDATGIILAAAVTATLGLPMAIDLVIEYAAGFAFGLFIFQSLFMKEMMGGTYWENVRKTFLPEFISMNAMMAGMGPVMAFLMMGRDMRAMEPTELLFWGVMSLGVMAGFALAYPFNVWMVAKGLKHGLMTERKPGTRFHMARPANPGNEEEHGRHDGAAAAHGEHHAHPNGAQHDAGQRHHQAELPPARAPTGPQVAAMAGVTLLMLLTGLITPAFSVNLGLSARDVGGVIMPPGMIMDFNTPAQAMRDMAAIRPSLVSYEARPTARGDQPLEPRIENGVKVFDLEASVIRAILLQEWLKRRWLTYPAMLMEGGLPNFFTINGKAYPATDTIRMRVGETVKLRFVGSNNNFVHPMHVHGGPFEVVAVDGETLAESARHLADTVNVGPGQRFDVIWTARRPGKWLIHCHIPHHTTNNNVEEAGGGGLTMIIDVEA
ncbi:DUF4396 domain-containing protein [Inquilinus sp. OTU3971]|uniref:DUF4396 domain-containing protein n=1 Tax=Inquilinus sp. OTU3971 TaxID=3043855 RepID=UPI00313EE96B